MVHTHMESRVTLLPLLGTPTSVKDQALADLEQITARASSLFPYYLLSVPGF